jgi:hypothetical protein
VHRTQCNFSPAIRKTSGPFRAHLAPRSNRKPKPTSNWAVSIPSQTFYGCLKSGKDTPCRNRKNPKQNVPVPTLSRNQLGIRHSTDLPHSGASDQPKPAKKLKTNPHRVIAGFEFSVLLLGISIGPRLFRRCPPWPHLHV